MNYSNLKSIMLQQMKNQQNLKEDFIAQLALWFNGNSFEYLINNAETFRRNWKPNTHTQKSFPELLTYRGRQKCKTLKTSIP